MNRNKILSLWSGYELPIQVGQNEVLLVEEGFTYNNNTNMLLTTILARPTILHFDLSHLTL